MSFKDNIHKKIIVIVYHLTTEDVLKSRANRDWEMFDQLDEVDKLQYQLEELSMFESIFEDLTEDDMYRILSEIYNKRFQ